MTRKKKILFLTLYPNLQPSTRFRVVQFLPYLKDNAECVIRPLFSDSFLKRFHGSNELLKKLFFHTFEFLNRLKDIFSSYKYDMVFLQKGITTINYRGLVSFLLMFNKNIIFDFDDAVTIGQVSSLKRFPLSILEDRKQVYKIIKLSKVVIVGNNKLKADIAGLNKNIVVIPTPVDTAYYQVNLDRYKDKGRISILWSGNKSGHIHLKICSQAILKLSKSYPLEVIILSDSRDSIIDKIFKDLEINFTYWNIDKEKEVFSKADIGIMPMYDTLWMRRKCAFKALLYMANGIPVVSSPVGIVNNFIIDGGNGLLANSSEEWFNKIELLIRDSNLRKKIGLNGRKTVEEDFSLSRWGQYWGEVIKDIDKNT